MRAPDVSEGGDPTTVPDALMRVCTVGLPLVVTVPFACTAPHGPRMLEVGGDVHGPWVEEPLVPHRETLRVRLGPASTTHSRTKERPAPLEVVSA